MKKTADVIIGANFGDEGKGLVTDFCAAAYGGDALVVRFNGGAQAGHTVTAPDGRRHVFSHFGAGSFAGAGTFLSRFFVCHPMLFRKEHALLSRLEKDLRVAADPRAPVTTPYDMMINQIAEDARGHNRHGSCGMGFGETVERTENSALPLTVADLAAPDLRRKLQNIRDEWTPQRLRRLGIIDIAPHWQARLRSDDIIDAWLDDAAFFRDHVAQAPMDALARHRHGLVFEGAQGLLLDQTRGSFPHVTRSNTGIRNVMELARDAGLDHLRVHYITRAYLTRHGAGPMARELPAAPHRGIHDPTNIANDWQGALRFAHLDADLLAATIAADMKDAKDGGIALETVLAVSCLDQLDDKAHLYINGQDNSVSADVLGDMLRDHCGLDALLSSWGPTRGTITRQRQGGGDFRVASLQFT